MAQDDFVSRRQSPLTTLTLDTLTILLTASAICASIFLLYLPKRLWKLRSSRVNTPWNWVLLMKIVHLYYACLGSMMNADNSYRYLEFHSLAFYYSIYYQLSTPRHKLEQASLSLWQYL